MRWGVPGTGQNGSAARGAQAGPGSSGASGSAEWAGGEVTVSVASAQNLRFSHKSDGDVSRTLELSSTVCRTENSKTGSVFRIRCAAQHGARGEPRAGARGALTARRLGDSEPPAPRRASAGASGCASACSSLVWLFVTVPPRSFPTSAGRSGCPQLSFPRYGAAEATTRRALPGRRPDVQAHRPPRRPSLRSREGAQGGRPGRRGPPHLHGVLRVGGFVHAALAYGVGAHAEVLLDLVAVGEVDVVAVELLRAEGVGVGCQRPTRMRTRCGRSRVPGHMETGRGSGPLTKVPALVGTAPDLTSPPARSRPDRFWTPRAPCGLTGHVPRT